MIYYPYLKRGMIDMGGLMPASGWLVKAPLAPYTPPSRPTRRCTGQIAFSPGKDAGCFQTGTHLARGGATIRNNGVKFQSPPLPGVSGQMLPVAGSICNALFLLVNFAAIFFSTALSSSRVMVVGV
jgi:hypothetical protein